MALHDSSIIELRGVSRFPPRSERPLESAVHEVDLRVARGGVLWLAGPCGGGKELLFRLLSLGEAADAGEIVVEGQPCQALSHHEAADLRARRFGFLAAAPFLIPSFNAIENIAVPLLKISRVSMEQGQERIAELLNFAGLIGKEELPAAELSAADQARLALARGLANLPAALFAEDLDDSLPAEEAATLTALLRRGSEAYGVTVIALEGGTKRALPEERRLEIVEGRIECDSALLGSKLS